MATFRKVKEQNFLELCADGTYEEIEQGIKEGININAEDMGGFDALTNAARYNKDIRVLKLLLKNRASITHEGNDGSTALMFAAAGNNDPEIIKALINSGAEINLKDNYGESALMWAVINYNSRGGKNLEVLRILARSGADLHARNYEGKSPITEIRGQEAGKIMINAASEYIMETQNK